MDNIVNKNQLYESMNPETSGFKHISFSEFSLYNECGHKHLIVKFLKLDEDLPSIHLFFGNAIHEAIELSVKDNLDIESRVSHFKEKFKKEMMNNLMNDPSFLQMNDYIVQGENILRTLQLENIFSDYEIVSVEEPLYEKIHGNYYFKGFIDLIARNKITGRYLIIDWKTSGESWNVDKKKADEIFMCQMRFYKFFWGRKHSVPMSEIDCQYVVLNRLRIKKNPYAGFGEIQMVPINSTEDEIKFSLNKLAETVKKIHMLNLFEKSKIVHPKNNCFFCKFKDNAHPLCNKDAMQYRQLMEENKK